MHGAEILYACERILCVRTSGYTTVTHRREIRKIQIDAFIKVYTYDSVVG